MNEWNKVGLGSPPTEAKKSSSVTARLYAALDPCREKACFISLSDMSSPRSFSTVLGDFSAGPAIVVPDAASYSKEPPALGVTPLRKLL